MDYFSRKSLSKYLMNNIELNKHDVDIFINGTRQKYADNIGRLFKITRLLKLHFWPTRIEVNLHNATTCKKQSPKSISNIGNSFALTRQQLKTENNKLNIYTQYLTKSTFETIWLFFHRPVGFVELLILYARVPFYTPRASDYRLISKTVYVIDGLDFTSYQNL